MQPVNAQEIEDIFAPIYSQALRPRADVIGTVVKVIHIAQGEDPHDYGDAPTKNQAATKLGRRGGEKPLRT